jgi:hypothetical protein
MELPHLFADDGGESRFEDLEIAVEGPVQLRASAPLPASAVHFVESEGVGELFRGNAPRRILIVLLEGGLEVEASDGTIRRIGAGEMVLADDTTGNGHVLRGDPGPRRAVFVTLPPDLDLSGFRP